ncbi:hypothetical protein ACJX0J_008198, partial [Zea mays]
MIDLSWNCQGLGKAELIREEKIDFIGLTLLGVGPILMGDLVFDVREQEVVSFGILLMFMGQHKIIIIGSLVSYLGFALEKNKPCGTFHLAKRAHWNLRIIVVKKTEWRIINDMVLMKTKLPYKIKVFLWL